MKESFKKTKYMWVLGISYKQDMNVHVFGFTKKPTEKQINRFLEQRNLTDNIVELSESETNRFVYENSNIMAELLKLEVVR